MIKTQSDKGIKTSKEKYIQEYSETRQLNKKEIRRKAQEREKKRARGNKYAARQKS